MDDVEAAWKLADQSLAQVDDNGAVTGMKELVQSVIRNYPYLERQPDTQPLPLPGAGGSPANSRRNDTAIASREALAKKYPALRSR